MNIRAATVEEVANARGKWAYLDIGFAEQSRSSAFAVGGAEPKTYRFDELIKAVANECCQLSVPLHLVIEAPLSAAFSRSDTPTGRSIELRDGSSRYWYCGAGATMLLATQYLLHALRKRKPEREIRLVEGFASFKQKGVKSSHAGDVNALRAIVEKRIGGRIVAPNYLLRRPTDRLECPYRVMGLHFESPPVVLVDG